MRGAIIGKQNEQNKGDRKRKKNLYLGFLGKDGTLGFLARIQ